MKLERPPAGFTPNLDITPLLDVVFLLLVFLLLTMTFSEDREEVEEAVIHIELAQSSTTQDPTPTESLTLLIDETGALYRADSPLARSREELRLDIAEKLVATPDLHVNVRADHRARHGQVIEALDLLKELGIEHVHLVIEKSKE